MCKRDSAGVDAADLLVAVTKSDEVNLVASMLAKEADVPRTVVRLEADELRGHDAAAIRRASHADLFIDPDHRGDRSGGPFVDRNAGRVRGSEAWQR